MPSAQFRRHERSGSLTGWYHINDITLHPTQNDAHCVKIELDKIPPLVICTPAISQFDDVFGDNPTMRYQLNALKAENEEDVS